MSCRATRTCSAVKRPRSSGPAFLDFVVAIRARGAELEVVSDGFDLRVSSNLAAIGLADVFVATNENRVGEGAAGMSFPFGHPSCFVCGTQT